MVVTEELLNNRLEKERAFILEAVTDVVHEVLYRDDSEVRNMLEQIKATRGELANLTELMKAYRGAIALCGSRRFDQRDYGAAPGASGEKDTYDARP
jgi:hypothetical protein